MGCDCNKASRQAKGDWNPKGEQNYLFPHCTEKGDKCGKDESCVNHFAFSGGEWLPDCRCRKIDEKKAQSEDDINEALKFLSDHPTVKLQGDRDGDCIVKAFTVEVKDKSESKTGVELIAWCSSPKCTDTKTECQLAFRIIPSKPKVLELSCFCAPPPKP